MLKEAFARVSYDDKSGNKRYITEIVAQRIQFLGGGGGTRLPPRSDASPGDESGMGGTAADG